MRRAHVDKPFLFSILFIAIGGFIMFYSASLSLFTNANGSNSVVVMQAIGLVIGMVGLYVTSNVTYSFWRKFSLIILAISIFINLLVFVPGLGLEHGGARRWIDLGSFTFQPSEILKIGYIIYLGAWLSRAKDKIIFLKEGAIPFLIITGIMAVVMYMQRDTDTLVVMAVAGLAMCFSAGMKWKHIFFIIIAGLIAISIIIFTRPYAMQRVKTYFNPSADRSGSSYQIQQSLIAIGSGGMFGRGLGQSIQKFNYLPEPIGDSIFAVSAEEFGFIGAIILVTLYLFILVRGLRIARKAPDSFGRLVVVGIVILVVVESYMNMSAMLGIIPLSGMPLLFVSHGGTALAIIIAQMGIILNVSASRKKIIK